MELEQNVKDAVQNLSETINSAVEKSFAVQDAVETLRGLGFEPVLSLKLEIGLQKMGDGFDEYANQSELALTDEDVQTLRRMKIRF